MDSRRGSHARAYGYLPMRSVSVSQHSTNSALQQPDPYAVLDLINRYMYKQGLGYRTITPTMLSVPGLEEEILTDEFIDAVDIQDLLSITASEEDKKKLVDLYEAPQQSNQAKSANSRGRARSSEDKVTARPNQRGHALAAVKDTINFNPIIPVTVDRQFRVTKLEDDAEGLESIVCPAKVAPLPRRNVTPRSRSGSRSVSRPSTARSELSDGLLELTDFSFLNDESDHVKKTVKKALRRLSPPRKQVSSSSQSKVTVDSTGNQSGTSLPNPSKMERRSSSLRLLYSTAEEVVEEREKVWNNYLKETSLDLGKVMTPGRSAQDGTSTFRSEGDWSTWGSVSQGLLSPTSSACFTERAGEITTLAPELVPQTIMEQFNIMDDRKIDVIAGKQLDRFLVGLRYAGVPPVTLSALMREIMERGTPEVRRLELEGIVDAICGPAAAAGDNLTSSQADVVTDGPPPLEGEKADARGPMTERRNESKKGVRFESPRDQRDTKEEGEDLSTSRSFKENSPTSQTKTIKRALSAPLNRPGKSPSKAPTKAPLATRYGDKTPPSNLDLGAIDGDAPSGRTTPAPSTAGRRSTKSTPGRGATKWWEWRDPSKFHSSHRWFGHSPQTMIITDVHPTKAGELPPYRHTLSREERKHAPPPTPSAVKPKAWPPTKWSKVLAPTLERSDALKRVEETVRYKNRENALKKRASRIHESIVSVGGRQSVAALRILKERLDREGAAEMKYSVRPKTPSLAMAITPKKRTRSRPNTAS